MSSAGVCGGVTEVFYYFWMNKHEEGESAESTTITQSIYLHGVFNKPSRPGDSSIFLTWWTLDDFGQKTLTTNAALCNSAEVQDARDNAS